MALIDALRSGVKVADKVTKSFQTRVSFLLETTSDLRGEKKYLPTVPLLALVDLTSRMVRTKDGVLTASRGTITLLDNNAVVAATNGQGIRTVDKMTMPNGETAPILDVGGFVDPATGRPINTTVTLG